MTAVEQLAQVIPLRPVSKDARELRYRQFTQEPPAVQPIAHTAWLVERQLGELWDQCASPYEFVAEWAPGNAEAISLLDDVFAAADDAAEVAIRIAPGVWSDTFDEYEAALHELAMCLRGAKRATS